jgi:hypothetical protein
MSLNVSSGTQNSVGVLGANTGPNIPAAYSLANQFLSAHTTSSPVGSNPPPSQNGVSSNNIPSFPPYGTSGVISPAPALGVGVSSFWNGLSGLAKNTQQ